MYLKTSVQHRVEFWKLLHYERRQESTSICILFQYSSHINLCLLHTQINAFASFVLPTGAEVLGLNI